jgi:hypothetical protein
MLLPPDLVKFNQGVRQIISANGITPAMRAVLRPRTGPVLALMIMLLQLVLPPSVLAQGGAQMNTSASQDATPTEDTEPLPISIKVEPTLVIIHSKDGSRASGKVTISGVTLPLGQRPVSIVIKNDDLPPMTKEIVPGQDGDFSFAEFAPLQAGEYEITATAPDGKGEATAKLTAIEIEDLEEKLNTTLTEAVQAAEEGIVEADQKITEQADSPAKQEAQKKIESAKNALAKLKATQATWSSAIRGTIGAIAANGAMAEIAGPGLDRLSSGIQNAAAETKRVRELTSHMSSADLGCHQLAVVTEVFKTISALLNIQRSILNTVVGLAKDVTSDVVANKAKAGGKGPAFAFASGQIVKNLPAIEESAKLAGNAYTIMADLGAFITDRFFSAYCEQFVGPVSAVMAADFMWPTKQGLVPYWSYHYQITGRLILYYPKSAKGDSIHLKGRIEGYAHGFTTWEDSLTVQFPKLMAGAIQTKRNWPPIEIGAGAAKVASQGESEGMSPLSAYVEGSAGGLVAPNSFLINVDGVLEKDSLSIVVGDLVSDFNAKHRVGVLILSPLTGGLGPQYTWYELPFLGARHVFTRGIGDQALKLNLQTSGKLMVAEGEFPHKIQKETSKAQYLIKIKVCNPGC